MAATVTAHGQQPRAGFRFFLAAQLRPPFESAARHQRRKIAAEIRATMKPFNVATATATATAFPDGSPRQCICAEDIEPGSPVALNDRGFEYHPQCIGLSSREAEDQARGRHTAVHSSGVGSRATPPPPNTRRPDAGDLVAAALAASDRGGVCGTPFRDLVDEELFKNTGHRLPTEQSMSAPVPGDNGDKVAAAMGLTLPPQSSNTTPQSSRADNGALVAAAMGLEG